MGEKTVQHPQPPAHHLCLSRQGVTRRLLGRACAEDGELSHWRGQFIATSYTLHVSKLMVIKTDGSGPGALFSSLHFFPSCPNSSAHSIPFYSSHFHAVATSLASQRFKTGFSKGPFSHGKTLDIRSEGLAMSEDRCQITTSD
eukprot:scaffold455771_cov19-Prasinocladus_malaysianus.AAC.1